MLFFLNLSTKDRDMPKQSFPSSAMPIPDPFRAISNAIAHGGQWEAPCFRPDALPIAATDMV